MNEPAHPLVRVAGWIRLGLLKELSGPARDVLMVLATYASKEQAQAFPAVSTVARLTGRSRSRIFEGSSRRARSSPSRGG